MNREQKNHTELASKPTRAGGVLGSKKFLFFAACLIALVSYVAGTRQYELQDFIGNVLQDTESSEQLNLSSLQETYRSLEYHYAGSLDREKLIDGANKGLVEAAGDDYTAYLTAKEAADLKDSLEGEYGSGIGAQIGIRKDIPTVIRVLPGNAAQKAGVYAGDQILKVNDEDVTELTIEQVVSKILGEEGTTVKLQIARDGKEKNFSITRAKIDDPSVYSRVENGIGILTISRFDNETGMLAEKETKRLMDQNIRALIVDLRGDGGGYLDGAVDVASLWIDGDVVVTQRKSGVIIDTQKAAPGALLDDMKTVLLVDQGTASASEILAGALRDYDKAKLVGTKTFGKGSVQGIYDLRYGAQLKVTISKWYTPDGINVDKNGLKPDVEVDLTSEDLDAGKDPQLEAAKKLLAK